MCARAGAGAESIWYGEVIGQDTKLLLHVRLGQGGNIALTVRSDHEALSTRMAEFLEQFFI